MRRLVPIMFMLEKSVVLYSLYVACVIERL